MKTIFSLATIALACSACATTDGPIAGIETTSYTTFTCEGKGFSARLEEDRRSMRLRTPEGSVNVVAAGDGMYKGDGWTLASSEGAVTLKHRDKVVAKNCKKG